MRIGIFGPAFSGKSTLANKLCTAFKDSYPSIRRVSFAGPIYEFATTFFGMGHKDRPLLQAIGMKWREIDEDVWANAVVREGDTVIVDDGRFVNEANVLKREGFILIKLCINKEEQLARCKQMYGERWQTYADQLEHISEQDGARIPASMFDVHIDANKETAAIVSEAMDKISEL